MKKSTKKHQASNIQSVPVLNRIVIGDVGSGKTIVAFITALSFLHGTSSPAHVALLAPTEILAFQHFQSLLALLKKTISIPSYIPPLPIYASSKTYYMGEEKYTKAAFHKALSTLDPDTSLFWIGTHTLLHNENVKPQLVLVDEQHRFGVNQRQKLTETSNTDDTPPHFISFSATPIPRTLALTLYDSLKPHFLTTLPNRTTIDSRYVPQEDFESSVIPVIEKHIKNGKKVYIVCPKVVDTEDENDEVWSLQKTQKKLTPYFGETLLVVHGKDTIKTQTLSEFKESSDKNILLATTVIEVGVDVPQATLMIIINSERFGLAALHQIRGRIGRNSEHTNECLIVSPQKYAYSNRLQSVLATTDGFELAQKDLQLRGSGDATGTLQSGFDEDIEAILGLDTEEYSDILSLVKSIDMRSLPTSLPRLAKYLESNSKPIWKE
jgi:ATP-dependent DNA helicase RecG